MISKTIGLTGIDTIKIGGFHPSHTPYAAARFLYAQKLPYLISVSQHKTSVTIGRATILWGLINKTKQPYTLIEIKSSMPGEPNLEFMTLEDVKSILVNTINELNRSTGIYLNLENSTIQKIEIGRTFPLKYPYSAYRRITLLLAHFALNQKGTVFSCENDKLKGKYVRDSIMVDRSTSKFRIYNKRAEMESKREALTNVDLMRIEFFLKNERAVKSCLGDNRLDFLFDEDVAIGFQKKCDKIYKRINRHFPVDQVFSSHNEHTGPNISAKMMLNAVDIHPNEQKFINVSKFIGELLSYELNAENDPCLLDIEDCRSLYTNLLRAGYKFNESVNDFCARMKIHYKEIDPQQKLSHQREQYEEIVEKTTENRIYTIDIDPLPGYPYSSGELDA